MVNAMEPIKKALERMQIPNFSERYENARQEILGHPDIQNFIQQHQLEASEVEKALPKFLEYVEQAAVCCHQGSVKACTNTVPGCVPVLIKDAYAINVKYVACQQKKREDEQRQVAARITSLHMPKDTLNASMQNIDYNTKERLALGTFIGHFLLQIKQGQTPAKGLYLHGSYGVGKSYVLGALANDLALLGVASVLVYVPEFLLELKQAIDDRTLLDKIKLVKEAPILMLDDLGAETLSAWSRDEVLGSILHYRMAEKLPVFISSNFDYDELEEHFAHVKGNVERVKATRLMERIKATTEPINMTGESRR